MYKTVVCLVLAQSALVSCLGFNPLLSSLPGYQFQGLPQLQSSPFQSCPFPAALPPFAFPPATSFGQPSSPNYLACYENKCPIKRAAELKKKLKKDLLAWKILAC